MQIAKRNHCKATKKLYDLSEFSRYKRFAVRGDKNEVASIIE